MHKYIIFAFFIFLKLNLFIDNILAIWYNDCKIGSVIMSTTLFLSVSALIYSVIIMIIFSLKEKVLK